MSDATSTQSSSTAARTVFPTIYLSHGAGPSYFMEVPEQHELFPVSRHSNNAQWLRDFTKTYGLDGVNAPKAIVIFSAHYETSGQKVKVTNKKQHKKLYYDYGGFPAFTYKLEYNPPGNPQLAQHIVNLLKDGNIKAELDSSWNFDHGVFVPCLMIWPEANIPIVELSIDSSRDPVFHLNVGKALRSLKNDGVLLIGSGALTSNFNPVGSHNKRFVEALTSIIEDRSLLRDDLIKKTVTEWTKLPSARSAHSHDDHFVPYFVVVGAAEGQQGRAVGTADPTGKWPWHLGSYIFE